MPPLRRASDPSLIAALEGNRILFFSRMAPARGGVLEAGPLGVRMSSGVRFPIFNWVLRTRCTAPELEGYIESTLRHYRQLELPFYWGVGPDDTPAELPAKLRAAGFEEGSSPAMAVELESLPNLPASQPLEIRPVETPEELTTFARTLNAGDFRAPPEVRDAIPDLLRPSLSPSGREPELRCFVGYHHDVPVATSLRFLSHGVVGIYGVATVPDARGRGFGSWMTLTALRDGQALGYGVGVLVATTMGEPVYRRLGFREVYRVGEFQLAAH